MPEAYTVPVDCRSVPSADGAGSDTLRVAVYLENGSARRPSLLLVRVDPLTERGAVLFEEDAPQTAAAVSVALTTSAVFQGCVAQAPSGFELRVSDAPRGRVWLRVSSNVPVTARLIVGGGSHDDGIRGLTEVVVSPGASARTAADGLRK